MIIRCFIYICGKKEFSYKVYDCDCQYILYLTMESLIIQLV